MFGRAIARTPRLTKNRTIMAIVLFDDTKKIPTDRRVINAILRRAQKKYEQENGPLPEGVRMESSPFGYIEVIQYDKEGWGRHYTGASWLDRFSGVLYKGKTYCSKYFSGYFCPYVVEE
jgi:hypothetical protein